MNNDTHTILYAEHTEDPKSWASPQPSLDVEKFNRELEKRGGLLGSVPRFRLRWGGNIEGACIEEFSELTGYVYIDGGEQKFVSCNDTEFEFPDNAVISPHYEYTKVYVPRWMIEEYDGAGYRLAWTVETLEKKSEKAGQIEMVSHYRAPSEVDLQIASGVRSKRETLSPQDIAEGLARDKAKKVKDKADAKQEIREEMTHWAEKYISDGVKSPVFSIPLSPEIKNIPKEQIAKI